MKQGLIAIFLTGIIGLIADWSLLFSTLFGVSIAFVVFRRFIFDYWKQSIFVVTVSLLMQYIVQVSLGMNFYGERFAFMVSPLIFVLALKTFYESNKIRPVLEHKAWMWLLRR